MNRHLKKSGPHYEQNCYDKIKQKSNDTNLNSEENKLKKLMSKANLFYFSIYSNTLKPQESKKLLQK